MKRAMKITCLVESRDDVGEGVIWNDVERKVYWVDVYGKNIRSYSPETGEAASWDVPQIIGSIVFDRAGNIVAGLESGFCRLVLAPLRIESIINPQPEHGILFNDGKCDRAGRYFVGTLDRNFRPGAGKLWRLDPDLSCQEIDSGITVSNGLAWSPDDRVLYFADTRGLTVYQYDYDIGSGEATNRRVFISTEGMKGRVDGATVDTEGYYWAAMIHDGCVCRYDPKGRLVRRIDMPVRHPTMCTFGGPSLDIMYVVSARRFLTGAESEAESRAGSLFSIEGLGVRGFAEPRFAG